MACQKALFFINSNLFKGNFKQALSILNWKYILADTIYLPWYLNYNEQSLMHSKGRIEKEVQNT